jgi:hypothetical protein
MIQDYADRIDWQAFSLNDEAQENVLLQSNMVY